MYPSIWHCHVWTAPFMQGLICLISPIEVSERTHRHNESWTYEIVFCYPSLKLKAEACATFSVSNIYRLALRSARLFVRLDNYYER
jgi:hypothetical protein